jgi:hypothetical protein
VKIWLLTRCDVVVLKAMIFCFRYFRKRTGRPMYMALVTVPPTEGPHPEDLRMRFN